MKTVKMLVEIRNKYEAEKFIRLVGNDIGKITMDYTYPFFILYQNEYDWRQYYYILPRDTVISLEEWKLIKDMND